ncbi:hypothetical protein BFS10_08085 [Brucella suis]|nr:hypothetical protein BFS10_08085 [Brucella suis]
MAIESHLATLEKKHGALEEEISEAMASPAMDDLHIASLKRKKLVLKEQIRKTEISSNTSLELLTSYGRGGALSL